MRFNLFIFSLFIFGMVSCSNGDRCYESVDTLMVTSLSVNGVVKIKSLIINGVDRHDLGDTIVNDLDSAFIKRYALPLSLSVDSTGLVLNANGKRDTLYIRHTMTINFISENCGFAPDYVISGFRYSKGIDSVTITDKKVNPKSIEKKPNDQNISIYFNPVIHK